MHPYGEMTLSPGSLREGFMKARLCDVRICAWGVNSLHVCECACARMSMRMGLYMCACVRVYMQE